MTNLDKITACAMAAHEMNRIYCISIGDHSQPHWEEAPDWARESAVAGVSGILAGNTPAQSHESWLKFKEEHGWVYGPVKDATATPPTHPCIMPYGDLPAEQRHKDSLFAWAVKAMADTYDVVHG